MPNFAIDPWGKCTFRIPFIPLFPNGIPWHNHLEPETLPLRHDVRVPAGSPPWVTVDHIRETIEVWQPYSRTRLRAEDALEILVNVRQLLELMIRGGG
jgi:hypothetical protein